MTDQQLHKTVLITGASSGIGMACARLFAKNGYRLILTARRKEKLAQVKRNIESAFGAEVLTLTFDIQNRMLATATLMDRVQAWQDVDILINNAGLALDLSSIQTADIGDWETMIDTNIKGLLYVTRAILPNMLERNEGHIINVCSTAGHDVYPNGAVYCATKHAVKALSQGLKLDCHGTPIRITNISPGMVHTAFSNVRFKGDATRAEKVYEGMTPLTAEDVAQSIYFCANQPSHVNISELTIMATDQSSVRDTHRN